MLNLTAPGYYDSDRAIQSLMDTSPRFSFGGKPKEPSIEDIPAPGAYSPEKVEKALNGAPSYTFGSKYKDQKPDDVPAPNSYNIPDTIGGYDNFNYQAPKYTMGGKDGDIWGTNKNPGPGSYNVAETDIIKQKSPAYTMSQKTNIPSDKSKKPGPGTHSPEKVVMQHSPSFSFGIKHSPFSSQYQKEATARNTEESVLQPAQPSAQPSTQQSVQQSGQQSVQKSVQQSSQQSVQKSAPATSGQQSIQKSVQHLPNNQSRNLFNIQSKNRAIIPSHHRRR
ncbi:outer dense fiber protein 3 [Caerostris extrusa]|uniref:Outer dense fiber protein 3 n=1 Tax=Caerostris extrusa TaxID=172846 RepID=A0AAV4Y6Z3_CAEEX|nr:outer dense fiber protein 3 [Caerostris extrusa]